MTMIANRTRDAIADEIRKTRAEQTRLPSHWVEKRELLAQRLEGLVNEYLDTPA